MKRLILALLVTWCSGAWAFTGFFYRGECFQTEELARKAYYASYPVSSVPDRTGPIRMTLSAANFTNATVYAVLKQPPYSDVVFTWSWPAFTSCERMDWADGAQLGWLVAGVWLSVSGLLFLARSVYGWGKDGEDHANA